MTADDEGTKTRRSALMVLSDPGYYKDFPQMDVIVLVGGQPLKLLATNIPDNLKLLKFGPNTLRRRGWCRSTARRTSSRRATPC